MFNNNFFPTPSAVIAQMLEGENIAGKIILEPSAGKGDIIDALRCREALEVLSCEKNEDLAHIVRTKSRFLAYDFLTVTSEQISHIDGIYMNPPFDTAARHILHAFRIAPAGCRIVALCNTQTLANTYSSERKELTDIIAAYGSSDNMGDAFYLSERSTSVHVSLIKMSKPGGAHSSEFDGFYLDDEPADQHASGLMPYNVIRDLVNRYVQAVHIFDKQLSAAVELSNTISSFYHSSVGMTCTQDGQPLMRANFKKDLQKSAWHHIFHMLDMKKYATRGLKEDINKFVETQTNIPFTMRNIYKMMEIIAGTQAQRMDRALEEVFDKLTMHYDENRYHVEGWKTNSHYLVNEKFIMPYMVEPSWGGTHMSAKHSYNGNCEMIDDMVKALCHLTGQNYDLHTTFWNWCNRQNMPTCNTWYDWGFFEVKGFKKGTAHFRFKDPKVWELFNKNIARIKGYPLYERTKPTPEPKKQPASDQNIKQHTILATIKLKKSA